MGPRSWIGILSTVIGTAVGVAGCGGGGGGDSAPAPSAATAKVRFINTRSDVAVQFSAGAASATLDARGVSPVAPLAPGSQLITARLATGETAQARIDFAIDVTETVALTGSPTAPLQIIRLGPQGSAAGLAQVGYYNLTGAYPSVDVYLVPVGTSVDAASPQIAGVVVDNAATAGIAAGIYEMVVTPPAKKIEIFRSGALTLAANSSTWMLGAARLAGVVTPQPILVSAAGAVSLEDSRPLIRILRSSSGRGASLQVDGEPILLSTAGTAELHYHLSPGPHLMVNPTWGFSQPFTIDSGTSYVQLNTGLGSILLGTTAVYGWAVPRPTSDFALPEAKGRVRLQVTSTNTFCGLADVYVDGELLQSAVANGEWVLDRNAGPLEMRTVVPGNPGQESVVQVDVQAGEYYLVLGYNNPVRQMCVPRILEIHSGR